MYFLGVDPGLSEVGFGIIEFKEQEPHFVDCGIIKTTPKEAFGERLNIIKNDLHEILKSYSIRAVGVEELFFVKNITNGIKVAHARGVIIESISHKKLPLFEFTPNEVKSNICGSGHADKEQIQLMVKRLLHLNEVPKPHDAADALAIAILTARVFQR